MLLKEILKGMHLSRDPRGIADKAEKYVRKQGYEYSYWGPEVEFFVFDRLKLDTMTPYHGQRKL